MSRRRLSPEARASEVVERVRVPRGSRIGRFEGLTGMKAKDWPALQKAFWKFVREPLMNDPGQKDKWKEIADGAQSNLELGRQLGTLGKQGQIQVDDDEWTVRWYTLCSAMTASRPGARRRSEHRWLMLFDWYDQDKKVQDEVRRYYPDREYGIVRPESHGGLFRDMAGDKME